MNGKNLKGIVIKAQAGIYNVKIENDNRIIDCYLRGRLKRDNMTEDGKYMFTDPIAVGDEVLIALADGQKGAIEFINERRSKLSRLASGTIQVEQVIVANADQMIAVISAKLPKLKTRLIDRFLILAEAGSIDPVICINKMDLLDDSEKIDLYRQMQLYEHLGYKVIYISALKGDGLEFVINTLRGKLSAFIGQSGTGKTTLLNALIPDLNSLTKDISHKTRKGKHATTSVQLYPLDFGGYIVDTPGIRELGLWDIWKEDMHLYFPEMKLYLGHCKFYNCSHISEPECAIRNAVKNGDINPARYDSYVKLRTNVSREDKE